MILLLGSTTYIGQAFARALRSRKDSFIPLSRSTFDYTVFEFLFDYVRKTKPDLVINAEEAEEPLARSNRAKRGELSEEDSLSESQRLEMLDLNVLLPQTIARVCLMTQTPWAHVSSGSIYRGGTSTGDGAQLARPNSQKHSLPMSRSQRVRGFIESDEPNCSFKHPPCSFYNGTKALAEEVIQFNPQLYSWRFRLPFGHRDESHNFLSQLQDGLRLFNGMNSLSQVDECVAACLGLWERQAAFGIYNVVNPGAISFCEIVQMVQSILKPAREFELLVYEEADGGANREGNFSDCVLEPGKLLSTGIELSHVSEAVEKALEKWERKTMRLNTFA